MYLAFLSLYYLLIVVFHVKESTLAMFLEPCMHTIALVYPLVMGVTGLIRTNYNPLYISSGWCMANDLPDQCSRNDKVDCVRGGDSGLFALFSTYFPAAPSYAIIIVSMVLIVFNVRRVEKRIIDRYHRYNAAERQKKQTLRDTFIQAALYIGTFFLTYIGQAIIVALQSTHMGDHIEEDPQLYFVMAVINKTFLPLGGFWNCLIYIRPRYMAVRRRSRASRSSSQGNNGSSEAPGVLRSILWPSMRRSKKKSSEANRRRSDDSRNRDSNSSRDNNRNSANDDAQSNASSWASQRRKRREERRQKKAERERNIKDNQLVRCPITGEVLHGLSDMFVDADSDEEGESRRKYHNIFGQFPDNDWTDHDGGGNDASSSSQHEGHESNSNPGGIHQNVFAQLLEESGSSGHTEDLLLAPPSTQQTGNRQTYGQERVGNNQGRWPGRRGQLLPGGIQNRYRRKRNNRFDHRGVESSSFRGSEESSTIRRPSPTDDFLPELICFRDVEWSEARRQSRDLAEQQWQILNEIHEMRSLAPHYQGSNSGEGELEIGGFLVEQFENEPEGSEDGRLNLSGFYSSDDSGIYGTRSANSTGDEMGWDSFPPPLPRPPIAPTGILLPPPRQDVHPSRQRRRRRRQRRRGSRQSSSDGDYAEEDVVTDVPSLPTPPVPPSMEKSTQQQGRQPDEGLDKPIESTVRRSSFGSLWPSSLLPRTRRMEESGDIPFRPPMHRAPGLPRIAINVARGRQGNDENDDDYAHHSDGDDDDATAAMTVTTNLTPGRSNIEIPVSPSQQPTFRTVLGRKMIVMSTADTSALQRKDSDST